MRSDTLLLTPAKLAALVSTYYQELKGRDLPEEMVFHLVTAYHDVAIERFGPKLAYRNLDAPEPPEAD